MSGAEGGESLKNYRMTTGDDVRGVQEFFPLFRFFFFQTILNYSESSRGDGSI